jgi:hypothetical protein
VTGEIVTAALLNEQIKDNGLLTAPAIMTTAGDIMYASAANTPARLAKSTTSTQYLANTGTSNVPAWNEVALATGVSGTLPVANGGTAATSAGIAAFNSITGYSAAGATGTTSTNVVFSTSPTLVTPALGTPSSGTLTSCVGLPEAGLAVSNAPTNGYMLTAQSGDAGGMTWAAAGGGALNLIGTVVASNDATITVTGLDSTYDAYLVIGSDLVPATDSQQMQIRLGDSSGVDSGASDYEWWRVTSGTGNTSWSPVEDTSDADMQISGGGVGNDTDESGSFMLWLPLPGDTDSKHFIYGNSVTLTNATVLQSTEFLGSRLAAITCDRIQFLFSSGNVTSGRMTVWGLAHA